MTRTLKFSLLSVLGVVVIAFQNCGQFQGVTGQQQVSTEQPSVGQGNQEGSGQGSGQNPAPPLEPGNASPPSSNPSLNTVGAGILIGADYRPDDGPSVQTALRQVTVSSVNDFLTAVANALPGDLILLEDGVYRFNSNVRIVRAGTPERRIFVRAKNPGRVIIEHCNIDGFLVRAPYWIFEELIIRGVCLTSGASNAHAFHIVAQAHHTYVRHCLVADFQSHVKLNQDTVDGVQYWPDHFRALYSRWTKTFLHSGALTDPKNVFNIDGGNFHQIRGNIIWDLPTLHTGRHHNGIYIKAGVQEGLVESNIVVCKKFLNSLNTVAGIFSGDQTGPSYVCNGSCTNLNMVYRNNIVLNCSNNGNSSGMLIANESQSIYAHNLVAQEKWNFYDTRAIGPNYFINSVFEKDWVYGGTPRPTEQNVFRPSMASVTMVQIWPQINEGDLTLARRDLIVGRVPRIDQSDIDFCGHRRGVNTDFGPIEYSHSRSGSCINDIRRRFSLIQPISF